MIQFISLECPCDKCNKPSILIMDKKIVTSNTYTPLQRLSFHLPNAESVPPTLFSIWKTFKAFSSISSLYIWFLNLCLFKVWTQTWYFVSAAIRFAGGYLQMIDKSNRYRMPAHFNETCLKEQLLPNYMKLF